MVAAPGDIAANGVVPTYGPGVQADEVGGRTVAG